MTGRRFFWLAAAVFALAVLVAWALLPEQAMAGRALVELALAGALVGGLLLGMALSATAVPWRWVNVPEKEFWSRTGHQRVARRRLEDDLYHCGAWVLLVFAALAVVGAWDARHPASVPAPWRLVLVAVFAVGLLVTLALRMRFYRRMPGER